MLIYLIKFVWNCRKSKGNFFVLYYKSASCDDVGFDSVDIIYVIKKSRIWQ